MKWAKSLPTSNPPTWLGLAPNAEAALLASRGEQLLSTWQVTEGRELHGTCDIKSMAYRQVQGAAFQFTVSLKFQTRMCYVDSSVFLTSMASRYFVTSDAKLWYLKPRFSPAQTRSL